MRSHDGNKQPNHSKDGYWHVYRHKTMCTWMRVTAVLSRHFIFWKKNLNILFCIQVPSKHYWAGEQPCTFVILSVHATVLGLCVCVCVCVCVSVTQYLTFHVIIRAINDTNLLSGGWRSKILSGFLWKCFVAKLECFLLVQLHDKSAIFYSAEKCTCV